MSNKASTIQQYLALEPQRYCILDKYELSYASYREGDSSYDLSIVMRPLEMEDSRRLVLRFTGVKRPVLLAMFQQGAIQVYLSLSYVEGYEENWNLLVQSPVHDPVNDIRVELYASTFEAEIIHAATMEGDT